MLITEEYRALNAALHSTNPEYGTSGHRWAGQIELMAHDIGAKSILDYGAGKQTLGQALSHMIVAAYDPAIEGLSDRPEPADFVACTDVLEHIEPNCLDAVLDDISALANKGVFLTVATRPAKKVLADGRNAHLIQESSDWWLPKLWERWDIRLFQAKDGEFAMFGRTKLRPMQ